MPIIVNKLCYLLAGIMYLPILRNIFPDSWYIRCQYRFRLNKKLNLKNPVTFNEKIQWLKLNDRQPLYTKMADKYEVRKIVKEKIGKEYLVPLIVENKIRSPDDIDFDKLPDEFVIKCSHDSGSAIIITKNTTINKTEIIKHLKKKLRHNYYWIGREWVYKNIEPGIIIEKLLSEQNSSELMDYKIFCFNGVPKFIQVDFDRFTNHRRNIYSTEWEYMGFTSMYPTDPSVIVKRPANLEKMLTIASILSKNIPHVRVDLYNTGEKIYFGELTFYHGSGFEIYEPNEWDKKIGDMLELKVR